MISCDYDTGSNSFKGMKFYAKLRSKNVNVN